MSTPNFLEAHRRGLPIVMPSACACGSHADGHGHAPSSASPATDAATTVRVATTGVAPTTGVLVPVTGTSADAAVQPAGGPGPAGGRASADAPRDRSVVA